MNTVRPKLGWITTCHGLSRRAGVLCGSSLVWERWQSTSQTSITHHSRDASQVPEEGSEDFDSVVSRLQKQLDPPPDSKTLIAQNSHPLSKANLKAAQNPRKQRDRPAGKERNAESKEGSHRIRYLESMRDQQTIIKIGNSERVYNNVFLRDSCTCPKCVHESTRQKIFSTVDIPEQIRVKSSVSDDSGISFTWESDIEGYSSDHVTWLSYKFLKRSISKWPVRTYKVGKTTWNADRLRQATIDFEYEDYVKDDRVLSQALRQLHTFGMIFIQNVPEREESVIDTATRIGPLKNTFYGSTWDVRSVSNAKNVAYTDVDLGFHMDLLYMHQPPRLQLLHCLRASTHGGISLFTDSYLAVQKLFEQNRPAFNGLIRNPVNFHYDNSPHHYYQSRHVIQMTNPIPEDETDSMRVVGNLEAVNWAPPFQGPFNHFPSDRNSAHDRPLARNVHFWHKAARAFRDTVETPSAIYKRQMKPGECVIFDNRRVLHARTAFSGGERWLRGAYIDSDPYLSRTRVLEREFSSGNPFTEAED